MAIDLKNELVKYLAFNEGLRTRRYYDSRGFPTVGVGFNLARPGAKAAIEAAGADFDRIKSGKDGLTQNQVTALLASDESKFLVSTIDLFD